MKVSHLSYGDIYGGAARAAYRLHLALRSAGMLSQMYVNRASSGDWTVHGPTSQFGQAISLIRPQLAKPFRNLLHTCNPVVHSPALFRSRWPERLNASDADVVHLHWVQGEMLSFRYRSHPQTIVRTLHDMWPFCGAEHYSTDSRWREGYRIDNRPSQRVPLISTYYVAAQTWFSRRPMQIVTPSLWLSDCVRNNALMWITCC